MLYYIFKQKHGASNIFCIYTPSLTSLQNYIYPSSDTGKQNPIKRIDSPKQVLPLTAQDDNKKPAKIDGYISLARQLERTAKLIHKYLPYVNY
ncbi:hypothetical protein SAMN02745866_03575 [Alteromonadaceae bacterium Bs31]|nr:hypothetical protein SAMN02745866_03575 [Alteromonadaceae bacterium Bs31]